MADSQRLFALLDEIKREQNENHNEVCQRLTAVETKQHDPMTCPAVMRLERDVEDHKKQAALEKRDAGWKALAKEIGRAIVAAIVAVATAINIKVR